MVGYAYQKRDYEKLYAYGTGGSSDKITTIDASAETLGSSTMSKDVEVGFLEDLIIILKKNIYSL